MSLALLASSVACAGPHSTGALWAQQYVDQEMHYFSISDAQHREVAHEFELGLADESLAAESQRLQTALAACPGPSEPLSPSVGDAARDGIRIQAGDDQSRLRQVAQLALIDWYVRRAAATGDARFCQRAQAARSADAPTPADRHLLDGIPVATVSRTQAPSQTAQSTDAPLTALSRYVLGTIDTVQSDAPLPQYLAWVYGGFLTTSATPVDQETALAVVDAQAPAFRDWEPDALYAALRGAQP